MKLITSLSMIFIFCFCIGINIFPSMVENTNAEAKGCYYLYRKGDNKSYMKCLETACGKGLLRACGDLGYRYALLNVSTVNDKYKNGIQLMDDSCDKGDATSCSLLGFLYTNNKSDINIDKGFEYLNKGCFLGLKASCDIYNHIFLYHPIRMSSLGISKYTVNKKVYKEIYDLSKKMCGNGVKGKRYCESFGLFYVSGDYIKADINTATKIFQRGCDLEEYGSCEQLSLLYKEGKFVSKNLELSKKYEKLAHKYIKIYNKQLTLSNF